MKPNSAGRRLIGMRGAGVFVFVVAGALVLAGCASDRMAQAGGRSVANAASAPAADGRSSPTPLVSIGSPAPSDAAEHQRVQAVTELAQQLLAQVGVPTGARALQTTQVGDGFDPYTGWDDRVDVADSWTVPGTADAVLTYVQQHLPPSLTWDGSGGGAMGTDSVSYRAAAGPADTGATVEIEVAADPAGGVDLWVDVHDAWQPLRPASDQVPATVTGAKLVRRTGVTTTPPPPTTVTIHVGADIARHVAALLDALPSEPGGPADAGGGANETITVTFDGDPSKTQYVVAGSFYDAVTVSAPSQALPTLSNAGDLDTYLEGLF
jgi:hypothetical protein